MAARKDYAQRKGITPPHETATPEATSEPVLTVNGQPIPDHLRHMIRYEMTDQGIAEESAKRKERGVATPGLSVVGDAWDKTVARYEADERNGPEPWEDPNPINAAIARVPDSKGKAFHLFSDATVGIQGRRGFTPERDASGELIRVGNMVLGSMDEWRAQQREQYFKNQAVEAEGNAAQSLQGMNQRGVVALDTGETVQGRDAYNGIDAPATIGHTRQHVDAGAILTGG